MSLSLHFAEPIVRADGGKLRTLREASRVSARPSPNPTTIASHWRSRYIRTGFVSDTGLGAVARTGGKRPEDVAFEYEVLE